MSIIIRLQNLPINAKSGDIRNFFSGLRIPDGGVHILGGEMGDAFIAFMSDEDARLAMRKDGGKIKGARVKLFLSSHMEMEHEVGRITKNVADDLFQETMDEIRSLGRTRRSKSPERRKSKYVSEYYQHSTSSNLSNTRSSRYRSHSPRRSRSRSLRRSRSRSPRRSRSRSPRRLRSRSPRRSRSRSPKRSRSPIICNTFQKSYKSKTYIPRKRSVSPYPAHRIIEKGYDSSSSGWKSSDCYKSEFPSKSQIQSDLEKRITEELEKNYAFREALSATGPQDSSFNFGLRDNLFVKDPYLQNIMEKNICSELISQDELTRGSTDREPNVEEAFYITMTGLNPKWNFREVQIMLKGIFAPHDNLRWEKDEERQKTGIVFVKLANREDYETILQKGVIHYSGHRIAVTKCPKPIVQEFFINDFRAKNEKYPQIYDLCFMLKGLPFSCTYSDVIQFFNGFEIADIVLFYGNDGRATGTGFVAFRNWQDFERAKALNGKKISHRYIELLPSTDAEMQEAKRAHPGGNFVPYSKILLDKQLPLSRRPLCALLTGLPFNTSLKKVASLFSKSGLKPDAIHVTLNQKQQSDGRAFVEFSNVLDFDLALKFHRQQHGNNSVKQILYDEMVKILDSQKAKHYFENPASVSSASNEPEKVPYLWEPPDEGQETSDIDAIPSTSLGNSFSFSGKKKHTSQAIRGLGGIKEKFGTSTNDSTEFNVKIGTAHRAAFDESFHSTKKYEDNIRLSRLSPDNEAVLLSFLNKDRNLTPELMHNRSPDSSSRGKNFDDTKNYFKPKLQEDLRSRYKRNFKYSDEPGRNSNRRSPSRSNRIEDGNNEDDSLKECTVQLTNVNTSIGLNDLMSFLKGFKFHTNSLIRGYTNEGVPTPDVRVSFQNRWEAQSAIEELDGCYIKNEKISMFIVSSSKN